ncbi:unnamed protein product [Camellia sinensis]
MFYQVTITLSIQQSQNILGIESKAESHRSNSNSSNMKKQRLAHVIGTLVSSPVAYPDERAPKRILQDPSTASANAYKLDRMEKLERKEDNLASIREHVKLGRKITETVKGKLSLGAKIIRAGGVEKIFKHNFSIREGEKLLKASQCYLSTTAGPIAGLLFISTDKVAFFSDRSIKLSSPTGEFIRIRYKVVIPLNGREQSKEEIDSVKFKQFIKLVYMKNLLMKHTIGIPVSSVKYSVQKSPKRLLCNPDSQYHIPPPPNGSLKFKKNKVGTVIDKMNKLGEKADHLANVRLDSNISETVKGKLRLGVKILKVGGMERIFKQKFNITEGEKLLKACKCYFERSIKLSSPNRQAVRIHYKVLISLVNIKGANESRNTKRPSREVHRNRYYDMWQHLVYLKVTWRLIEVVQDEEFKRHMAIIYFFAISYLLVRHHIDVMEEETTEAVIKGNMYMSL